MSQTHERPVSCPPGVRGTNVMAILALVFAFVFTPLGVLFGHLARRQIGRSGEAGAAMATTGLVLSYLITAVFVASIVYTVAAAA